MTANPSRILDAIGRLPDWAKAVVLTGSVVLAVMFFSMKTSSAQEQISKLREDVSALKEAKISLKREIDTVKEVVLRMEGKLDTVILMIQK